MHEPVFKWPTLPSKKRLAVAHRSAVVAHVVPKCGECKDWILEMFLAAMYGFCWSQTGVALDSTVQEFAPFERLAWFAESPLVRAYHTWDLREIGGRRRW